MTPNNIAEQDQRLKIAIQKSGRLAEESRDLLSDCGIELIKSKDQLFCTAKDFPLDVFFVRDDDIPAFVESGVCQAGIVGENVLYEHGYDADNMKILRELGFGTCRLSLAAPHEMDFDGPGSLQGKHIATSYPGRLKTYLDKNNIAAKIVTMQGAVEIAPRVHMADLICDLVSTGGTLAMNGLREIEPIFHSQAVLVRHGTISGIQETLLKRLCARLDGVNQARESKYIMLHAPVTALEDIRAVLPGAQTPTILNLQDCADTVAVHAVCNEDIFWSTMEDLKAKGAHDILVLPIEKMMR